MRNIDIKPKRFKKLQNCKRFMYIKNPTRRTTNTVIWRKINTQSLVRLKIAYQGYDSQEARAIPTHTELKQPNNLSINFLPF